MTIQLQNKNQWVRVRIPQKAVRTNHRDPRRAISWWEGHQAFSLTCVAEWLERCPYCLGGLGSIPGRSTTSLGRCSDLLLSNAIGIDSYLYNKTQSAHIACFDSANKRVWGGSEWPLMAKVKVNRGPGGGSTLSSRQQAGAAQTGNLPSIKTLLACYTLKMKRDEELAYP